MSAQRLPVPLETLNDGGIARVARSGARIDDDVDRRQFMLVLSERFSNQALDAITTYRDADHSSGDRQAETRPRSASVARKHGK